MLLVIFLLKKQKNSEEVRKAQKTGKEGREITASHDSKCNKEEKNLIIHRCFSDGMQYVTSLSEFVVLRNTVQTCVSQKDAAQE